MRGRLLAFDFRTGNGEISGLDGQRYRFSDSHWMTSGRPKIGEMLDFEASGERALAIYSLGAPAGAVAGRGKNRFVAALLAFFLGGFGIHKFYLGKNKAGVTMLLCFLFGWILLLVPTVIVATIALIETIIYLVTSDEVFEARYVRGDKSWF